MRLAGNSAATDTRETFHASDWEIKKSPLLKNVKGLACSYKAQKESWIDSQIFKERIR